MATLTPIPFPDLVRRMRSEVAISGSIFDLPASKWFTPSSGVDFSASHFGRTASTPVGPAAGPHTQLAQNIVLSWLAGGRIMELKTVQVNDRLEIPRPCIHVPNVGYNVEWSQELLVEESLFEYAKAVFLIEILKATRVFGVYADDPAFEANTETVYDISVGYNLEGIRSDKVTGYLRAMQNPSRLFDQLRLQLDGDLESFRDIPLPRSISDCVTLSTFHGCPADQIEAIAKYLLEDLGFHTILKLNPTLLGFAKVKEILVDELGYRNIELRQAAFDSDLQYDDGLEILRRLRVVAEENGSSIGAKFTNTLVVENRPDFFQTQTDPYMYVSGPPLHVISMTLMQQFREDLGFEFPVSFSAGIDRVNFPAAVACGIVPVTTCTDLLRQGGYSRLPRYLVMLEKAMQRAGVTSRESFVLTSGGNGVLATEEALRSLAGGPGLWDGHKERITETATDEPDRLPRLLRSVAREHGLDSDRIVLLATRIAGRLNGRDAVPALINDRRYHAEANRKEPRHIDSVLDLYDCINCDLCISACPNDAIFAYEVETTARPTDLLRISGNREVERSPGRGYTIRETHQLAVLEAACNECSNCEVYCPENGAPFLVKEHVFLSLGDFRRLDTRDGFCRDNGTLHARIGGVEMSLIADPGSNHGTVKLPSGYLEFSWDPFEVRSCRANELAALEIDTADVLRMRTVWNSIFNSRRPNMVHPEPAE
jgi:putative selenate reductase